SLLPAGAVRERADLVARIAGSRRRCGRAFASREALESALRAVDGVDETVARGLQAELALDHLWHGRREPALAAARALRRSALQDGDRLRAALAAAATSLVEGEAGEIEAAVASLDEAREAFAAVSDDELVQRLSIAFYVGLAALRLERVDEAVAAVERGLEV